MTISTYLVFLKHDILNAEQLVRPNIHFSYLWQLDLTFGCQNTRVLMRLPVPSGGILHLLCARGLSVFGAKFSPSIHQSLLLAEGAGYQTAIVTRAPCVFRIVGVMVILPAPMICPQTAGEPEAET
jgi:hypothetical protein